MGRGDVQHGEDGLPVHAMHGARALKEGVSVEVWTEPLEGVRNGRNQEGEARTRSADPAPSLPMSCRSQVLARRPCDNEQQGALRECGGHLS